LDPNTFLEVVKRDVLTPQMRLKPQPLSCNWAQLWMFTWPCLWTGLGIHTPMHKGNQYTNNKLSRRYNDCIDA
jgi:hypothetical protein